MTEETWKAYVKTVGVAAGALVVVVVVVVVVGWKEGEMCPP